MPAAGPAGGRACPSGMGSLLLSACGPEGAEGLSTACSSMLCGHDGADQPLLPAVGCDPVLGDSAVAVCSCPMLRTA